MEITRVRAPMVLARDALMLSSRDPEPAGSYRAWESLMLHAANRIAATVAYDAQILEREALAGQPAARGGRSHRRRRAGNRV